MGGLKVPKKRAERPNDRQLFPEGTWLVELDSVRVKDDLPDWMFTSKNDKAPRIGARPAEQLGLQFGSAQALNEGQDDAGNQKLFLDMLVMDSGTEIHEVDLDAHGTGIGWGIRKDAALFTNLAIALGQAVEVDGYVSPSDDFLAQLRDGVFNGHKVVVEVEHGAWKSENGKSGVNVNVVAFSSAA